MLSPETKARPLSRTLEVPRALRAYVRAWESSLVWCLRMTALRPVIVVRSSVQNPATIPCDQRLFQGLSTASSVRAPSGRNRFHCRRTKAVGLRPTVLVRCLMAGMAGRRSGRNGCFGAAAAGVLHGARTIPTVAGRSMRALSLRLYRSMIRSLSIKA